MTFKADPIDIKVGMNIRTARTVLGITQQQLGKHLGITFPQIQKYERGLNRVSASTLSKIATVLNKHIGWFFDEHIEFKILESTDQKVAINIMQLALRLQGKKRIAALQLLGLMGD